MKNILIAVVFVFASIIGYSQCVPDSATGTAGVRPAPDAIPCIERGVPYNFTMQFENFGTFGTPPLSATVDSARIDSLVNFPCGIAWQASKLLFLTGETGCIDVFGTSTDAVGQYSLKIYMTIWATTPLGPQMYSGEVGSILAQIPVPLPIDLNYFSRVIDSGDVCPPIDTTSGAINLTACGPVNLKASVSATQTAVCPGTPVTLTASAVNRTGALSYSWSNGGTTSSITVAPTVTTPYSVTVIDQADTAIASTTVTMNPLPTAVFAVNDSAVGDSALVVTVTNTSTSATSFNWDFGDDSTSFAPNPLPHTYTENDTYTITLITHNSCGYDTTSQDVVVSNIGVFINPVKYDLMFDLSPNPSKGTVALKFSAENKVYDLKVFDLSGKTVFEEKITATTGTVHKQLDLSRLPKGIYTLHLSSGNSLGVKKLQLN